MDKNTRDALGDGCLGPFSLLGMITTVFMFGVGCGLAFVLGATGLPFFLAFFVPFGVVALFWYLVLKDAAKK